MSRIHSTSFLTGLVVGCALGAVAGLLTAPQRGYGLATLERRRATRALQPVVDETLEASFPASDPPSWTPTTGVTGV